jgi:hypothetical protein
MEEKTISNETLERIKSLPRINYDQYLELIKQGQIIRLVKLRKPRTIFFDEETGLFLYVNHWHMGFSKCAKFKEENI